VVWAIISPVHCLWVDVGRFNSLLAFYVNEITAFWLWSYRVDDWYQRSAHVSRRKAATYHARASARPATPPAIKWVLSGIFSLGAGVVEAGLLGFPSSADLIDMAVWSFLIDNYDDVGVIATLMMGCTRVNGQRRCTIILGLSLSIGLRVCWRPRRRSQWVAERGYVALCESNWCICI